MRSRLDAGAAIVASAIVIVACGTEVADLPFGLAEPHLHSFAGSAWSQPVVLAPPVNSACSDQTPTLSRDELRLYFLSDRPGGLGEVRRLPDGSPDPNGCLVTFDLWVARRSSADGPWEMATSLGPPINTAGSEVGPELSVDEQLLFFSSDRDGVPGSHDIFVSRRDDPSDDLAWGTPVRLGDGVNTAGYESGPSYVPSAEDGRGNLYFYRGAANDLTTDIYVAAVERDGGTLGPAARVDEVSVTGVPDGFPTVRADGREMLINSRRPGGLGLNRFDLWMSTRRSVHDPWSVPENVGVPVSSTFPEFQPNLSHDGCTLLFIAGPNRGGAGGFDIWMSTRAPSGM